MDKIIQLGADVPVTHESRVRLLDHGMLKTAASEIQSFWDGLPHPEGKAFLWVIGVSAQEYYGCNNNGDAFSEADLKARHSTFVRDGHIFLHHVNRDPARSIGRPVFSWYNDTMHRVELILEIDKSLPGATNQVARIKSGEDIYVSMGCRVAYDQCSICGNKAPTRAQYCDHLRFNLRKILPDGRQVYALNPKPTFFDISIVAKPADPTACALDKAASRHFQIDSTFGEMPAAPDSAELAEQALATRLHARTINKFAAMVKELDGSVADLKDDDSPYARVRRIGASGFDHMPYPDFDDAALSRMGLSPAGLVLCLLSLGAPLTLGDAAWMTSRPFHGECAVRYIPTLFRELPDALSLLADSPEVLPDAALPVLRNYGGELDNPLHFSLYIKMLRPVAEARITLVRSLAPEGMLCKLGSEWGVPPSPPVVATGLPGLLAQTLSRKGENFAQVTFTDAQERTVASTPYHLHQAQLTNVPVQAALKGLGAALALSALGAAMTEPSLLGKLLYSTVLGLPAAALLGSASPSSSPIKSREGVEIPTATLMEAWKQEKRGALLPGGKLRLGTVAGMAVPSALALDYAYNKWKYGPYPPPGGNRVNRTLHSAGRFVTENPVLSVAAGGLLGALTRR